MPKEIPPATFPYHPKHSPNVSCAFHAEFIGHSTEDCLFFKTMVQELIDKEILSFSKEQPNMKTNPLLVQNRSVVSAIIDEECT